MRRFMRKRMPQMLMILVNGAKAAKSRDVVSALEQAKSLFMLDPGTTAQDVSDFNADPDSNFDKIAPYLEVNGVQPQTLRRR